MENCLDQIKSIFLESNKTKLAIVGRGMSIAEVNVAALKDEYFIITLNGAEEFVQADMTVFYREDLMPDFEQNHFPSRYYVAPSIFELPSEKHIKSPYQTFSQEGIERIYSYFASQEFYILDITLISAIKLSLAFQEIKGIQTDVFFLGFDFYLNQVQDYDIQGLEYRNAYLRTQESLFVTILNHIKQQYTGMNLHHVGSKKYSTINIDAFNKGLSCSLLTSKLKTNSELYHEMLAKFDISNKVIVVAEFTNNHIGDRNRLVKMIELAVESGADMIKVQKRDVKTFYTEKELGAPYTSPFGSTLLDYRQSVEFTAELFQILDLECRRRGIPWFASVLDWNSYLYMQTLDCPLIKLPSTISNHKNYLTRVAEDFGGELVVSTGFTDQSYEDFILEHMVKDRKLFLLQCTSSYPTPPEGCQVSIVRHYDTLRSEYPNIIPGYSSHDLGSLGCMMAVAAGARMIEKHVKLGDLDWVHFDSVAIDLYNGQFKSFVSDIRKAEIMCGSKVKKVHQFEHHKYQANNQAN